MPLLSDQNRRKRNLVIIAGFLVLLGRAAVFDLGVFAPELPVASNIVVFALFNLNLIVFLLLLRAALPQPGQAVVRARAEGDRRQVQGQARAGLPVLSLVPGT